MTVIKRRTSILKIVFSYWPRKIQKWSKNMICGQKVEKFFEIDSESFKTHFKEKISKIFLPNVEFFSSWDLEIFRFVRNKWLGLRPIRILCPRGGKLGQSEKIISFKYFQIFFILFLVLLGIRVKGTPVLFYNTQKCWNHT